MAVPPDTSHILEERPQVIKVKSLIKCNETHF